MYSDNSRYNDEYAIYLRKSRADIEAEKLGEGETLARHKKILTELAARKGLFVRKIFHEIVSGETIAARPQIQELMKECYEGKYRGIIIIDVDRLSRGNQGDMQKIMDCLKFSNNNSGLLVITPTKTYDVAHNSDDEEYMEFVLFMSRREYKTIQKRLDRGRKQAVVEGNFMGSYRPYGYNIQKNKRGRFLVPHPEESKIVQLIFEWRAKEDLTPRQIAVKLDNLGVPTYTGAPEWSLATVKTILQNPTYIGKVRWNDRMIVKTMIDGEVVASRPRSNHTSHYMEYDGKHEAIIDQEIFEQVQKKFYSDRTKGKFELTNPLASILVCAKCQKAMVYHSYKKQNTGARIQHKQSRICRVKSALFTDVLEAVVHALKLNIEDCEIKVDNTMQFDKQTISKQIELLHDEYKKTEKKLNKIFNDYENDIYTANEFVQRKKIHTEKMENIQTQIQELEDSIPQKEEYEEKLLKLSDALEALQSDAIGAKEKNKFLKEIIEKIEYSRENNDEFILDITLR